MIYTIGDTQSYCDAWKHAHELGETIFKCGRQDAFFVSDDNYNGGYAFRTIEDAQRRITEENKVGVWSVFGLDCDWENTYLNPDGEWWSHLINDANIIMLDGTCGK